MHAIALRDEDIQQMAARAMHAAPDFDGEPAREARVAPRLAAGVLAREAAHFRAVFDANASSDAEAPEAPREEPFAQTQVATRGLSDALDADHLASFAEEQFALGDAARAALKRADAASRRRGRGAPPSASWPRPWSRTSSPPPAAIALPSGAGGDA